MRIRRWRPRLFVGSNLAVRNLGSACGRRGSTCDVDPSVKGGSDWSSGAAGSNVEVTVHMASFGPGYSKLASMAFRAAERICARFTDYFVAVGWKLAGDYVSAGIGRGEEFAVIHSPIDI